MRMHLVSVLVMAVIFGSNANLVLASTHLIEVEDLTLSNTQAKAYDGASGKVVPFTEKGAKAVGEIELKRGVYEVTLDMVAQGEHNDAILVGIGDDHWRTVTWKYGQLAQSHPYILTILPEKKTYSVFVAFAEPGVAVDRIQIKPLLTPKTIAQLNQTAKKNPGEPADVTIEVESLTLANTQAQDFSDASGKVVAFHAEGAEATGQVMLSRGVYRVTLDMVSQDEHNDAIHIQIGDHLMRTMTWTYGKVSPSKARTFTVLEENPLSLKVTFAEPGVFVDRITIHPLLTPEVIAEFETKNQKKSDPPDLSKIEPGSSDGRPRVIVTSDGEIDDECSMVRFLLYTNDWDVEAIITSSSQYHWRGHRWAGDDWIEPYLEAYAQVYPNLIKHDPRYPTPAYLQARTLLGNVKSEGDMEEPTAGSQYIVKVLLDKADNNPVWLQAWGGVNTIARALKTIQEEHPDQMSYVADKIRLFLIWEQDSTYQDYIRPHWGQYNILTINSDQFVTLAYGWDKNIPNAWHRVFRGPWMKENILQGHGPLCSLYKAHQGGDTNKRFGDGDFRSEGDSPAFMHSIVTGLRSMESPDWGGWGGRYVESHENIWLDPVLDPNYQYPTGRYYSSNGGRHHVRKANYPGQDIFEYCKPIWRWSEAFQNDWAARADWCVKSYDQANHAPIVTLAHALDLSARPGDKVCLSAQGTTDPDGDALTYHWWQYHEADTYEGFVTIESADRPQAAFTVPQDATVGKTIHLVCEVTDAGSPPLTRYQRVVVTVER